MAGTIRGITIDIGGDTSKLSKALQGVNKDINNTQKQLKDVNKLLKLDPSNTELIRQKQSLLADAIGETKTKLDALKEASKKAEEQLKIDPSTQDSYDAIQREIVATEQNLKDLEEQAKKTNATAAKISEIGGKMQEFGSAVAGVGKDLTTKVTVPLVAAGGVAVAKFAEVDKVMNLTNQTMGNTETEAELLNKAMSDAAANSVFGMSDAANATLNFARAGLDAEQAAAALAPAMNLAAGEGGDLDTVSAGLVATINGFHGSFDDAAKYADVFANACNNSALDVNSLSSAMSVAAPIFATAGYDVNDAALFMGVMANNGIEASVAANSLKTGFARLVTPVDEGAKALEKFGFSITNADGTMKSTTTIQRELHNAFADLSEAEQIAAASAIFGKNQMSPWLALINTAPEDVRALSKALNEQGTTTEMAGAMMGGFGGSVEKLKSSVDVLMTSLGQLLAQSLTPVIEAIQGVVDKFLSLDTGTQQIIVTIGMIVAAVGPVLIVIGTLISSIGTIMTALAPVIGFVTSAVIPAIGAVVSPVLIVVAVIGGLIAAIVELYRHNEEFRNKVNAVWEQIKTGISNAITAVKNAISNALNVIKTTWNNIWTTIQTFVTTVFTNIQNTISTIINTVQNVISTAMNAINSVWTSVWNTIKGVAETVWNLISTAVNTYINAIKTVITAVMQLISGDWQGAWNTIKTFVTDTLGNIVSSVTEKIGNVKETIVTKIGEAVDFLKSLPSQALQWGKDMIGNFVDGIKEKAAGAINAVKDFAGDIADFLHFSEPDKGALKDFHTFAPDMMALFAQGIKDNSYLVTDQVANLTKAISSGLNGDRNATVNVTSNTYLDGRLIASQINSQLGAML